MTDPLIAFAGTPAFAVPTLDAILAAGYGVPLVLTQPDRPAGRGRRLKASAVKEAALAARLTVLAPETLKALPIRAEITARRADLLVVVAYGLIMPPWLLAWPQRGAVNVHASLLPRWRGAAPIQRAILAGDRETGVSIMRMEAGLDTGPVYATERIDIGADDTAASLHDALAELGAETLCRALPAILAGSLKPHPQDSARVSYAAKINKAEAAIDWREPAAAIVRKVHAFNPWPVAESRLGDGRRLRIWDAEVCASDSLARPGAVLAADASGIVVATGKGAVRLCRIQAPSARVMDAAEYLAAAPLAPGASFVT